MIEHLEQAWQELTAEGSLFSWSVEDRQGVPIRVYDHAAANMREIWEQTDGFGAAEYLVYEDERYTYDEIHRMVRSLAGRLHDDFGVGEGDRVAIAMRNHPEWVVSYWAVTALGAAVVGMNAWWVGPELKFALSDSRPRVLIADSERLEGVEPHLAELRQDGPLELIAVRATGSPPPDTHGWGDLVDPADPPDSIPPARIDPADDACIFYTSGTTADPKGARLSHRGCVHNLMNVGFNTMVHAVARQKLPGAEPVSPGRPLTVMLPVPLFHVTGLNCVLHPASAVGGRIVLMHHWDADEALALIERERVTTFTGVPSMSREMMRSPRWKATDTSSLSSMGGGGAALQPDLVEKIADALPNGRPQTGYGLTETHGLVSALGGAFYTNKPESVGPPLPVVEARCVDDHGDEVGPGETGELLVRGPIVFDGYLNRPDATAEAIVDGWLRTGDLALIDDDGYIHIRDRIKDIVIRGGENIPCGEVEAAIHEHPDVAEAAVFGVPDDRLGEAVAAAVVPVDRAELTAADLTGFLEARVAPFKIPTRVWIRAEPLPRNANGKFVKRQLREALLGRNEARRHSRDG